MDGTTGLTAYAADTVAVADVFSDSAFREAIQQLDEYVPMDGRFLTYLRRRNSIMGMIVTTALTL